MTVKQLTVKATLVAMMTFGIGFTSFAQELTKETVTTAFNEAIQNANTDPAATIEALTLVISDCEKLGSEGDEIKALSESRMSALYYKVAYDYYAAKQYSEAITAYEKALEVARQYNDGEVASQVVENLPALYYSQGLQSLKENNQEGAIALFNKALALKPSYAKAYYGKAKAWDDNRDSLLFYTEKALTYAQDDEKTASTVKKNAANALYRDAKEANKKTNYKKAIELIELAMKYDSKENNDRYYFELGKAYQGSNNAAKACEMYKKVGEGKYKQAADYEIKYTLKCS